jgi:hypothetical protein
MWSGVRIRLRQSPSSWTVSPSSTTSLPSFLSRPRNGVAVVRYASKAPAAKGANKPIVLEKPLKFNPPSHGSRLPKKQLPRSYGGSLTRDEVQQQKRTEYPGMLPAEGTWAHYIWTNRTIHIWLTMVRVMCNV